MGSGSWSREPEDLSSEPLLRSAPQVALDGVDRPSVGRYVLLSKLGAGGMGVVYHAAHRTLSTEVAIKLMPRAVSASHDDLVARFTREAQLAARLQSPHLVNVLDIAEDEATASHYIVMEFVNGASAEGWRAAHAGLVPEADALRVCIGATRGLVAAHLEGVVHRDIKPGNILIPTATDGTPDLDASKLADLGLARGDSAADGITRTQVMMGTPGYMPPEQARSARRAKKPADVCSMGATLYKLLTGRAPFVDPESGEWMEWTFLGRHADAATLRPDLHEATRELLRTCLAPDPERRFADASSLLRALEVTLAAVQSADSPSEGPTVAGTLAELASISEQGLPVASDPPSDGNAAPTPPRAGPFTPHPRAPSPDHASPSEDPTMARAPRSGAPKRDTLRRREHTGTSRRRAWPIVAAVVVVALALGLLQLAPWTDDGTTPPALPRGLHVRSEPTGATVYLNGYARGLTNLEVQDQDPTADRTYDVRVELDGYAAWSRAGVQVPAGEAVLVQADLIPWGTLSLAGLDGDVRVRTWNGVQVTGGHVAPPEPLDLVLSRPGYADQQVQVSPAIDTATTIPARPWEQFQARIDFDALPHGVTAWIDGRLVEGVLPFDRPTQLDVELRLDGHPPQVVTIDVALGETKSPQPGEWEPEAAPEESVPTGESETAETGDPEPIPERFEEWLLDLPRALRAWVAAPSTARRDAARFIDQREPSVRFDRLERFSAGGQSFEMAVFEHEATGLEMVLIPGGTFEMGSPPSEPERDGHEVQHTVTLTEPFLLARTECTQAAWDRIGGKDVRTWFGSRSPIEGVTWSDCRDWCRKAGLRLPTEAEWEYACRAGTKTAFAFGEDASTDQVNYHGDFPYLGPKGENRGRPLPGRSLPSNAFGLHEMHGNVWEWCVDGWSDYPTDAVTDPIGGAGSDRRVVRGGSCATYARGTRSAFRGNYPVDTKHDNLGFRPAMSLR